MGLKLGVLCVMKRKPHFHAGTVLVVPDKIRLVEITHSSCKPDEVRQDQKVINEMIMCLYKPNGDHN